jgi:aryl-alcohol dehydrogenase-like predicted oxidoreductase
MGVISWSPLAGGWLSGRYRKGTDAPKSTRSERLPQRFDLTLPANRAKLDAAEALAGVAETAQLSLIHMALGFVLTHPAITAAIMGPRTMEQLESQLGAADVKLSAEVLDKIDEIVPPGTTVNPVDDGWTPPAIGEPRLRRRSLQGL